MNDLSIDTPVKQTLRMDCTAYVCATEWGIFVFNLGKIEIMEDMIT